MRCVIIAFKQLDSWKTLELRFMPVRDRRMAGIDGCSPEICHAHLEEINKRCFDDAAMTDNHNVFAIVLMNNTVQGRGCSDNELHPVLAAIHPLEEWAFFGWHIAPESDKLLLGQGTILVAPLFHILFKNDGQTQRGCDNLGSMARPLHRAGNQHVNFNIHTCRQSISQSLSLLYAFC